MFNFLLNFLKRIKLRSALDPNAPELQSGALIDSRTHEEKKGDYKFKEMVASFAPVVWAEKPQSEWRRFPIYNQNGSGACVAFTQAKELGIMRWLKEQEKKQK